MVSPQKCALKLLCKSHFMVMNGPPNFCSMSNQSILIALKVRDLMFLASCHLASVTLNWRFLSPLDSYLSKSAITAIATQKEIVCSDFLCSRALSKAQSSYRCYCTFSGCHACITKDIYERFGFLNRYLGVSVGTFTNRAADADDIGLDSQEFIAMMRLD